MLNQEIRNKLIKTANQIYHRLTAKVEVNKLEWIVFRDWYLSNISQGYEVKIVDFNKPLTLNNITLVAVIEDKTPRIFVKAKHINKHKNRAGYIVDIRYKGVRHSKYAQTYKEAVIEHNKLIIEHSLPHKFIAV